MRKYTELEDCEHSQLRSIGGMSMQLMMTSGRTIKQLSRSRDWWMRFSGLRSDFVLNIVRAIVVLMKRVILELIVV